MSNVYGTCNKCQHEIKHGVCISCGNHNFTEEQVQQFKDACCWIGDVEIRGVKNGNGNSSNDYACSNNRSSDMELLSNIEHPLINPDSRHYQMVDGIESIHLMESMFTKEEMAIWAKITSYKYRFRLGKKDDDAKDIKKMKTYEEYYRCLTDEDK